VPELLINNQPLKADMRPLAGTGAGAVLCAGAQAGSLAGNVVHTPALPRLRWAAADRKSGVYMGVGYQPTSRTQFEHTTLIDPVAPGGLGPHPVREPEPV
jgi:hypothetical protein